MMDWSDKSGGWMEVITGGMYSGKTEELIRLLNRAVIAKQKIQVFKPKLDNRYSEDHVASHSERLIPAQVVQSAKEILPLVNKDSRVIGIDEAQFFDMELVRVANQLAKSGYRVLIAGLDTDWKGRPFAPMPELMAIAEIVHKKHAVCNQCGAPASRTQRLLQNEDDILVGSDNIYEARCRHCHDLPISSQQEAGWQLKDNHIPAEL